MTCPCAWQGLQLLTFGVTPECCASGSRLLSATLTQPGAQGVQGLQAHQADYKGTSLVRNRNLLGPYRDHTVGLCVGPYEAELQGPEGLQGLQAHQGDSGCPGAKP